jgi:hypothetical protein
MARPHIDALSELGAGGELATGAPTAIHNVDAAVPGRQRGDRLHIDLANGGASATDVTFVVGAITFIVQAAAKSITQLDFFVPAEASIVNITGQASATDVQVLGYHEGW